MKMKKYRRLIYIKLKKEKVENIFKALTVDDCSCYSSPYCAVFTS